MHAISLLYTFNTSTWKNNFNDFNKHFWMFFNNLKNEQKTKSCTQLHNFNETIKTKIILRLYFPLSTDPSQIISTAERRLQIIL